MRWVVVVKPWDDHPAAQGVYGPWKTKEAADRFRDKVRAAVEDENVEDVGFAWTMPLQPKLVLPAIRYAKEGL